MGPKEIDGLFVPPGKPYILIDYLILLNSLLSEPAQEMGFR